MRACMHADGEHFEGATENALYLAAYHQVYDSCHLQADYQEPGSAPELYARQSSIGYLYFFYF